MKVAVELIYDDSKKNHELIVEISGKSKGPRLMNSIDKAVEKAAADDSNWTRWNLKRIEEEPI